MKVVYQLVVDMHYFKLYGCEVRFVLGCKAPVCFRFEKTDSKCLRRFAFGLAVFLFLCIRLKARRSYISFLESVHCALLWCFFGVAALHVGIRSKARISSSNCAAAALLLIS